MSDRTQTKLPPDGGYGWVITLACGLKKLISIPIIVDFGLVLQEGYDQVNITATEANLVLVFSKAVEMMASLFGGRVIERFGYRKVAVIGSLVAFLGLMLTSTAFSFWQLLLYFSIILPIGESAAIPAFAVAVNSYFKEKRVKAFGIVSFAAASGSIVLPLIMSYLLYALGWRYTVLTLSGIYLHCVLVAFLLRPVSWYYKEQTTINEAGLSNNEPNKRVSTLESGKVITVNNDVQEAADGLQRCLSDKSLDNHSNGILASVASCPNLNCQESNTIINKQTYSRNNVNYVIDERQNKQEGEQNKKSKDKKYIHKIIKFFDLTLLKDPIFVNILCGLSIAPCAEISYNLLLPSILKDMMKLETNEIAKLMSLIAFSDLLFRLVGPYITEPMHKSPRVIYLFTLFASIISRSAMLFTNSFNGLIFVALAIGVSKGLRSAYMNVIIPNYVPIHRLPFAIAIFRFLRGITIASIGSLSLRIREVTGSYKISIVVLNIFSMMTILLWTAEFVYIKTKKNVSKSEMSSGDL